jgi:zinc D-Ala-D-Ala dipeptidase
MRRFAALLTLSTVLSAVPPWAGEGAGTLPARLSTARQLLVVTTDGWQTLSGRGERFERTGAEAAWTPVGGPIDVTVGRKGLAWDPDAAWAPIDGPRKQEGDGRSPAGVFGLGTAFGFAPAADARHLKIPYLPVTSTLDCVDDGASRYYNQLVDRAVVAKTWSSAERMLEVGEAYRWGVVVDYNTAPVVAGRGSCIFLHVGKAGHGTAGCTAMAAPDLDAVMRWLDPVAKPAFVQMPAAAYRALRSGWGLPEAGSP